MVFVVKVTLLKLRQYLQNVRVINTNGWKILIGQKHC